jgi:hypothetical protein
MTGAPIAAGQMRLHPDSGYHNPSGASAGRILCYRGSRPPHPVHMLAVATRRGRPRAARTGRSRTRCAGRTPRTADHRGSRRESQAADRSRPPIPPEIEIISKGQRQRRTGREPGPLRTWKRRRTRATKAPAAPSAHRSNARYPRPPLSRRQKAVNRAPSRLSALGERAVATLKIWKVLAKLRCCRHPRRATSIVQAILVLHHTQTPPNTR